MRLLPPDSRPSKFFQTIFLIGLFTTLAFPFQTKKPASSATKKPAATAKDAKKPAAKDTKSSTTASKNAKPAAKAPANQKTASNSKTAKPANKSKTAVNNSTVAQARNTQQTRNARRQPAQNARMTPAQRRREAARKKAEEAKRQAALAEQRRREQAAREARARKLAFERGLRTETSANIANDNTEGEDLRIRQTAINALGERAGTILVMDARTGRVITMVNQEWAIKQGFKPCSTIKLVTGVAGLHENLIDPTGSLIGDTMKMSLDDALAYSNNVYFQRVGANLGSDKMIYYAKRLGLGQKTGINADGETIGKLPYGNNNPRIYSHADDFEVTPLQLAVMVTAISNGGNRIVPQFHRSRVERTSLRAATGGNIGLPDGSVQRVIPGMIGAAEYGTARRGMDRSLGVAGKTGSCIGRGSWVGLFASVAPVEDPQYAVVVITRGESERGRIAAGIASQIYSELSGGIKRDMDRNLALRRLTSREFATEVAAINPADTDDEEEDDQAPEADTRIETPRRTVVVGSGGQMPRTIPAQPGRVVRTTQSRPTFPPVVIEYTKDKDDEPKPDKPSNPTSGDRPRVVKDN